MSKAVASTNSYHLRRDEVEPPNPLAGPVLKRSDHLFQWNQREALVMPPPEGESWGWLSWRGGANDGRIPLDEGCALQLRDSVLVVRNALQKKEAQFRAAPTGPPLNEWVEVIVRSAHPRSAAARWAPVGRTDGSTSSTVTKTVRVPADWHEGKGVEVVYGGAVHNIRVPSDLKPGDLFAVELGGGTVVRASEVEVAAAAPDAPGAEPPSEPAERDRAASELFASCSEPASYDGERSASGDREGFGRQKYEHGDVYEGEWTADKKHGRGTYTFREGGSYEGAWVDGRQEGRGEHTLANDDVYDGEWRAGAKHGRGTYFYALRAAWPAPRPGCVDGAVFEGAFADGEREGAGTHWHTDGCAEVAVYAAGSATGEGVRWSSDRQQVWRLQDGEPVGDLGLDEGRAIAERIGRGVPDKASARQRA
jgi:hypothetical protein